MYKTLPINADATFQSVLRLSDGSAIPFDPANTDYANFKKEILADKAQLQDANGNVMSAEQAKAYVGGLA